METFSTAQRQGSAVRIDSISTKDGERLPLIISGTVTDASGRILSGQTVTAFWHSIRHAQPLAVGLNCALGAALMRPYIQELARVAGDTYISCYPDAGLPNPMSDTGFDETPVDVALCARCHEGLPLVGVAAARRPSKSGDSQALNPAPRGIARFLL